MNPAKKFQSLSWIRRRRQSGVDEDAKQGGGAADEAGSGLTASTMAAEKTPPAERRKLNAGIGGAGDAR